MSGWGTFQVGPTPVWAPIPTGVAHALDDDGRALCGRLPGRFHRGPAFGVYPDDKRCRRCERLREELRTARANAPDVSYDGGSTTRGTS